MECTLQHWPQPMSRFGQNPYGQNLYRIVFAPSRRQIVYGEWPDGSRRASLVAAYPEVGRRWILEHWMSAFEYARCTPETWNMTMTLLGPYPERGEYQVCHIFDPVLPSDCNLDRLVMLLEAGRRKFTLNENTVAIKENEATRVKGIDGQKDAMIRNSLPAFGMAPMSGFGGGRGTKGDSPTRDPHWAGLPVAPGHTAFSKSNRRHEVLVTI
jgi:hypothetical protein